MDGDCPGNLSLGQQTGDGKSDGETFLGRTWMFFSGGGGGGEEELQGTTAETFSQDDASSKQSWVYVIYYMLSSGGHVRCSGLDNPSPSPRIEDGEGAAGPRSATDSTEQWV